ncbi:MAG TPA: DUF1232 domain-containing protein [Desulfobulbus sp.]|nr:DUF1232 domain-containing protein [Desulfobulbus sp.]
MISTVLDLVRHAVAVFLARETPLSVKLVLAAGLLYIISPYDLIPEWVPVLGVLDDLALAALLVAWASRFRVPPS